MKLFLYKTICILLLVALPVTLLYAQQKQVSKAAKKKENVERSYKKAYARARKLTIKHRYEIQTKATQERMDGAAKKAEAFNKQNDIRFFEHFLKRKRPKRR